jgi:guanylate kinase
MTPATQIRKINAAETKIARQPLLLVLSAPSGGGKTTISQTLLSKDKMLRRSISATTRAPRGQERDGRDYYFLKPQAFQAKVRSGAFLEYAQVHGFWYGTLRQSIADWHAMGKDVLLVIDVQGGLEIKRQASAAVLIFVDPPSLGILARRLRGRGTDPQTSIEKRLRNALAECAMAERYDYRVINRELPKVVAQIQAIITAERLRVRPDSRRVKKS